MTKNTVMLQVITDIYPYGYAVVEKVFDLMDSYDKTISILEHAASQDLNPLAVLEQRNVSETSAFMH